MRSFLLESALVGRQQVFLPHKLVAQTHKSTSTLSNWVGAGKLSDRPRDGTDTVY